MYPARLDMFYFYRIEFGNTTVPDLEGIQRAIALGLIDSFEGCNAYGEPVHAVRLKEGSHRYSMGGEFHSKLLKRQRVKWECLSHPTFASCHSGDRFLHCHYSGR